MSALLVAGATLLDATGRVPEGWLLARDGAIIATGAGAPPEASDAEVVDGRGATLVPGFLDLHVHGGGGGVYDGGDPAAVRAARAVHRAHGTTRSVLSLVANPVDELVASLRALAALDEPGVLGVHLEGPFLSPHRKGAHEERFLIPPDPATVERLIAAGGGALRQITIAPELPGGLDAVHRFVAAGVRVAIGHTEADHDTVRAAFDAGATLLTHAFNAMPPVAGRAPGPLGAALADDRVTIEVIADGIHVHPANLAWLFEAAAGRVALITDAMGATGSGDGAYRLGSLDVEVRGGRATLAGTDQLAGSTLTQDVALSTVLAAGVDPVAAIAALTTTPARALGIEGTGLLAPGRPADLVLLDGSGAVRAVYGAAEAATS